ncbi:FecR family protein [Pedobacter frigoris]|uniref:FecR family protein n=1 Tax=Pedobacter frigoris TaxID=2571272 RepID=A0A4U1CKM2_9SPHI|nr:FecR family protein [Pedobacter frigoris]TKC05979.1 FecR family protein [Pedobacter frigoris]
MKHDFSKDLFDKYVEGKCTEEEKAIVEGWYLNELKNSDFVPEKEQMALVQEEIWNGIAPAKKSYPFVRWTAYAAAIVIAVLFVYKFQSGKEVKTNPETKLVSAPVDRDSVVVASATENSMMKLSDGSVIILEKGSKLTILSAFNKKHNREVELEGKAFFDIAHNPSKPFIIYTGNVRTTVLGTSFDITAPAGSKSVKVNVIRGLVEVKNMKSHWLTYLKKNMQVVSEDAEMVSRKVINAEKELSWNNKEGIVFNDISFKDAKNMLEDRFQVKINLPDEDLQNVKFTTSLRANESLDHFLSIICNYNNAKHNFNIDSTEVSIKPLNRN